MTTTTFIDYDGDGSDLTFDYSFPTYKEAEVKVAVSGVIVDNWTITGGWAASGTKEVKFDNTTGTTNAAVCNSSTGAPLAGTKNVRIFRDTDIDAAKYTFTAGSSIKADELNTNHEQLRRALQEEQYNTINTYDIKDGAITSAKLDTNIDIAGTLDVTGATTLDSTLNVAGTSTHATVDINGGAIDGTTIGASSQAAGTFTTLGTTGLADVQSLQVDTTAAITGNTTLSGYLYLKDDQELCIGDDNNIILEHRNSSNINVFETDVQLQILKKGTTQQLAYFTPDGKTVLGYAGTDRVETTNSGAKVTGDLEVTGTYTVAAVNASGAVNIDGNLAVNTNKFNVTAANGNTTIAGTLGVTGSSSFTNAITGLNGAVIDNIYIGINNDNEIDTSSGNLILDSAGGTVTVDDNLSVTGTITGTFGGNAATATSISGVDATADELNTLDGVNSTLTAAELNLLDGKSVVQEIAADATDAQLPTAQAVNERITTVVADVGGFVPIASETAFPTNNPDLNDAAGTIVSIKALGTAITTGSGVTTKTITDGAGSGKNVTITGLTQSTTYPAGRGMLLETTQYSGGGRGGDANEYEYAFHRLTLDETGVAAAQAAIDDWDERYYGPVGSAPSTRPGGGSRVQGDLYFDTGDNQMKVWNNAASQWDDVASSASSNIVTLSPSFDGSETEFTCSTVPVDAQSLLLSINGVIQKPNSGTSTPSEGFVQLANGKIKLAAAPAGTDSYFAVALGNTVSVGTPSPDTVGTTELKDNEVTEVKLKIHAAPSGTDKFLAYTANGMEWAVPTDTNTQLSFANDANNRVITGTGSGLNGEANLTFDGSSLILSNNASTTPGEGNADNLTIEDSSHCGITLRSPDDKQGAIYFSDANSGAGEYAGNIIYDHTEASEHMRFATVGVERLRLDKDGNAIFTGLGGNQYTFKSDSYCILNIESDSNNDEGSTDSVLRFQNNATTKAEIRWDESDDLLELCHGSDNGHLAIDSSGRVLIGTTNVGNSNADNFTIADSAICGITIRSGNTSTGNIFFSDATGASDAGQFSGAIEYDHNTNSLRLHANGDERARIDSSGRLIVGNSGVAVTQWGQSSRFQVVGPSWESSSIGLSKMGGATQGPNISFGSSRGTTPGTIVQDGDRLGWINFVGDDGNDMAHVGAYIACEVDGTPGSNNIPGKLSFSTSNNDVPAIGLQINSDAYVTTSKVPCFWYAGLNNNQANGAVSSDEVLVFGTEQHKNGTHYSTTNGRFTAPVAGNYIFGFNGLLDNTHGSDHRQANLYKNGSNVGKIAYNYHTTGQYTILSGTACMSMAKDDYAQIWAQAGMHNGSETSFWGTLIG